MSVADFKDDEWAVYDGSFKNSTPTAKGHGVDSLKAALPDGDCAWGIYRYSDKYLVRLKWRPDSLSGLKKTKANQSEQAFLKFAGEASKVTVEILGKKKLTKDAIFECVKPGSGSKVIQD
eukprot:gb/GEZN01021698.1/.p1 GENE.gb/GEZN01021698.1/~~gb/GEZN01021698.1/.p1  ORF type:complete len:120 (+),score=23.36 gb/GEZN01021698.1/:37-396(+)